MAREIHTTCPSGLQAHLRGLKGSEINLFANADEAEARRIGYELLEHLVLDVDPGPAYPDMGSNVDWSDVIDGDRFWLYIWARIATYGPNYYFSLTCPKRRCRHQFDWGIKLDRDLRQQKLDKDSLDRFLAGNEFGPITFGGAAIVYQILTGKLEERGVSMQGRNPQEATTVALANRIKSIDGEISKREINKWLIDLDMIDLLDLIDEMDRTDCGLDTKIQVRCPSCHSRISVDLPLEEDFWTPSKRLRSLARKEVEIPTGGGLILPSSD